jgi:hypothetical protein
MLSLNLAYRRERDHGVSHASTLYEEPSQAVLVFSLPVSHSYVCE